MSHGGQNRGDEACGMMTFTPDGVMSSHRRPGRVSDVFTGEILSKLEGEMGIAHVRYATAPDSADPVNFQPLIFEVNGEPIGIVHNGNFTNREELIAGELRGTPMLTHSDTEAFFRLILKSYREKGLEESIAEALSKMSGVFSGLLLLPGKLVAVRDSWGTRPLCWGKKNGGYYVASETSSLEDVGILDWEEIPPGTILTITKAGVKRYNLPGKVRRYCNFEWVYFGAPSSTTFGAENVSMRRLFGEALARECKIDADVVVPVPDSANFVAEGFATASGIPIDRSLMIRKHNTGVGRTFLDPDTERRGKAVAEKSWLRARGIKGKRIILLDDSIVRGTTSKGIVKQFWERGAKEVHVLSGSPEIIGGCRSGIDTPDDTELIAANKMLEEIKQELGLTSIFYLSLAGFREAITKGGVSADDCCFACMDRNYFHA